MDDLSNDELQAQSSRLTVGAKFASFAEASNCCQALAKLQNKESLVKVNSKPLPVDDPLKAAFEYSDVYLRCRGHGQYQSTAKVVEHPKPSVKCGCNRPVHFKLCRDTGAPYMDLKGMDLSHNKQCNIINQLDKKRKKPIKPKTAKKKKAGKFGHL